MTKKIPKKFLIKSFGNGDFFIFRREGKSYTSAFEAVGLLSDMKAKKSPKGSFIKKGKIVKRRVK